MVLLEFHGEEQPQQQKKNQENDGGDCLGNNNSDNDDCDQVLCAEFKKERVLRRVFRRVIGE